MYEPAISCELNKYLWTSYILAVNEMGQGALTEGEGSVQLISSLACFVKKVNNIFNIKRIWFKLVSKRRSTEPSFPFSQASLDGNELPVILLSVVVPSMQRPPVPVKAVPDFCRIKFRPFLQSLVFLKEIRGLPYASPRIFRQFLKLYIDTTISSLGLILKVDPYASF